MVKSLDLPLRVHEDLIKVSEELSLMAKKTISTSMTIELLIEVYRAHLNNPCALDTFSQQLRSLNVMSPQEFDKYWDEPAPPKKQAQKSKANRKK
jgi:methyltransferase-like protein